MCSLKAPRWLEKGENSAQPAGALRAKRSAGVGVGVLEIPLNARSAPLPFPRNRETPATGCQLHHRSLPRDGRKPLSVIDICFFHVCLASQEIRAHAARYSVHPSSRAD